MPNNPKKGCEMRPSKRLKKKQSTKLRLAKEQLDTICKIGNKLTSTLDVDEVLNSIVRSVPKFLKASGCIVRIVDEGRENSRLEAAFGVSDYFKDRVYILPIGEGISGHVIGKKQAVAISKIATDRRFKFHSECIREGMQSLLAVPIVYKKEVLGVIAAFSRRKRCFGRPEIDLLSTFAAHAAIALNNAMLHKNIHLNYYGTISTLVKTIEARDPYTCGHSERVTNYAIKIAKKMNLGRDAIESLLYGGKLHDIGKIAIPDFILKKKARLNELEMSAIQDHPTRGIEMVANLKFLRKCFPVILHHHERYDGRGYPDGLRGNDIPLLARILSVADAFDAMTSERPYRRSLDVEDAVEEIKRNSRTQFDPKPSKIFVDLLRESDLQLLNRRCTPAISLAS